MTELRKLQLLEVNLLVKFQEICEKNNLTYYFVGGGLIGALRHGGFIPWDDDLDIVMPRYDYDKFVEICKNGIENGYGLIHYDTDIEPNWNTAYSQFVDLQSEIETTINYSTRKTFVWIDVFAIDGTPNNCIYRWFYVRYMFCIRYLMVLCDVNCRAGLRERTLLEKIILFIFRKLPILNFLNGKQVVRYFEKKVRKHNFYNSFYCCNFNGKYRMKELQPQKRWGTPMKLKFEDIQVSVPELYHDFQTHLYGNYMMLPPMEKRVAHNVKIIKTRE